MSSIAGNQMKKKQLEIILERLEGFGRPSLEREQYATPAAIAAEMLFLAAMHDDLGTSATWDAVQGSWP